jgi:UDP-N-acetylglucosamine pyrophosphorylase
VLNGNDFYQGRVAYSVFLMTFQIVDPEFTPFIPWIVMTSDATDAPTRLFFEENGFFGLDESQVNFLLFSFSE